MKNHRSRIIKHNKYIIYYSLQVLCISLSRSRREQSGSVFDLYPFHIKYYILDISQTSSNRLYRQATVTERTCVLMFGEIAVNFERTTGNGRIITWLRSPSSSPFAMSGMSNEFFINLKTAVDIYSSIIATHLIPKLYIALFK